MFKIRHTLFKSIHQSIHLADIFFNLVYNDFVTYFLSLKKIQYYRQVFSLKLRGRSQEQGLVILTSTKMFNSYTNKIIDSFFK